MKIAVPTKEGMVDADYITKTFTLKKYTVTLNYNNETEETTVEVTSGDHYTIFTVNSGEVRMKELLPSPQGCGCKSGIVFVLRQKGVQVMLAGNIGNGALNVLKSNGIEVVRGCSGNIDDLAGEVKDNGEACSHHDCENH